MYDDKPGKIGFITETDSGGYGNLNWGDDKYNIRNVRKHPTEANCMLGNIQMEDGSTYTNKAGKVCKGYKDIGALKYYNGNGNGVLLMELNGNKIKESFIITTKTNSRGEYKMLVFQQPNKFESELDGLIETPDVPF